MASFEFWVTRRLVRSRMATPAFWVKIRLPLFSQCQGTNARRRLIQPRQVAMLVQGIDLAATDVDKQQALMGFIPDRAFTQIGLAR